MTGTIIGDSMTSLIASTQPPRWRASPSAAKVPSNTEKTVASAPISSELPSAESHFPPPSTSWYQRRLRPGNG